MLHGAVKDYARPSINLVITSRGKRCTLARKCWYDHRVELLRQDSANRERANIQQQFQIDVDRLTFLTNIYALPLSQLDEEQLKKLESSWHDSSMSANLSWYILRQGELHTFFPNAHPFSSDKLQEIASAIINANKPSVAGAYLIGEQTYVITAVASAPNESVLLVRQLTNNDLLEYAQALLVTKVTMSHSNAVTASVEGVHSDTIEIPSLLKDKPVYLQVQFSEGPFQEVKFKLDWVSLGFILFGVFIVGLGYIWLRSGLLKPFKNLMRQLALVDPMSSVYQPVTSEGNEELELLASRVNSLLARIYQQKERENHLRIYCRSGDFNRRRCQSDLYESAGRVASGCRQLLCPRSEPCEPVKGWRSVESGGLHLYSSWRIITTGRENQAINCFASDYGAQYQQSAQSR